MIGVTLLIVVFLSVESKAEGVVLPPYQTMHARFLECNNRVVALHRKAELPYLIPLGIKPTRKFYSSYLMDVPQLFRVDNFKAKALSYISSNYEPLVNEKTYYSTLGMVDICFLESLGSLGGGTVGGIAVAITSIPIVILFYNDPYWAWIEPTLAVGSCVGVCQ